MTRNYLFGLMPYRVLKVDADTGKPIDPNIGRKQLITYYDIKRNSNGTKSIVAHKSPAGSAVGGDGKGGKKDKKKGGNGGGEAKKNEKGDGKKGEDKKGAGGGVGENKNPNDKEWTADEDAQLKTLKADGKTWKEIGQEMKRGQGALKARFKEIGGESDDKAEEKTDEKKDDAKGDGGGKQPTKAEKKAAKKAAKEDDGKKDDRHAADTKKTEKPTKIPSKAGSHHSGGGEARFTMNEWMTLQEDSSFSFGELQCLSELIMRDQNQTWLRIASSFYDKTGRKVHPDDVRDKFERMAGMG